VYGVSFLPGKRVLVTGGAGFLGRNVCRALRRFKPATICVPRSVEFDLRDPDAVRRLLADARPEVVLHLAAVVGGIGANRDNPGRFFYDNALMGIQLMEAARQSGVEKFVTAGTVCAYPRDTPVPFRESDLWNGYPEATNAPYGLAKKMLIAMGQAYRGQYGFNAISLLPANLYGPEDNFDPQTSHVIPALIRKMLDAAARGDEEVVLWGTGTASREFLFVRDAAEAVVLAAEHYSAPEPVNIGVGQEITIAELAGIVGRSCGYFGRIRWDATMPDGQPRRCLDTSRAAQAFGFQAKTNFEAGVAETVSWYRRNRRGPTGAVSEPALQETAG
jgi:GDP-L-fucose synthase